MEQRIDIFVDGACPNNGKAGARATWAWAVAYNMVITETHAEAVPADQPQTNQYAELAAFTYAFSKLPALFQALGPGDKVHIYSDSAYAIQCISTWGPTWKANGWARKAGGKGKPLEHIAVIMPLVETYLKEQERIELIHIAAHPRAAEAKLYPACGNVRVDQLAQELAQKLALARNE